MSTPNSFGFSGPDSLKSGGIGNAPTLANGYLADTSSAKQVIRDALQSGSGITRLTTQTGTASEVSALTALTGSADVIGAQVSALALATGNGAFAAITAASTWGTLVTAIAAS